MGRSCRCVVLLLAVLSCFTYSATASANDPEPLSLSVSSARETCTLGSVTTLDYTIDGGVPPYRVTVDGREIGQSSSPDYVPCRPSAFWSLLEELGGDGTQRIRVRVSDSEGARAYAIAELQLVPPLPAPRSLKVTSGVDGRSAAHLLAEWRISYQPREKRSGEAAIRWRVNASNDWTIEHHQGEQVTVLSYRSFWNIDSPIVGEQREVQVAQIRHIHDLHAPESLIWSPTALVTTATHPHELQAEATHDAITLSWGPHAPGLAYVAKLRAVQPGSYADAKRLHVNAGPLYEAQFGDLLPETLYRVKVYLDDEDRQRYPLDQHSFELRTEPAPASWSPTPRIASEIRAWISDREIEVAWVPPETGSRHDSSVCVAPSDFENFSTWSCKNVAPGESRATLSPLNSYWYGGSFQVRVTTLTAPSATATKRIHLPTYQRDLPTNGSPPSAPRFTSVAWLHHPENPAPGTWKFEFEATVGSRAEILWRIRDYWFYREFAVSAQTEGQFRIHTKANVRPQSIRYRVLRDGIRTPWSPSANAPDVTSLPYITSVEEYRDHVQVHWSPPASGDIGVSYRLYLTRNQGKEEAIDLGSSTYADIPIRQSDASYAIRVAAGTEEHGEVVSSYTHQHVREPLELYLGQSGSWCQPEAGDRARVRWSVIGGAAPFVVSIGDQPAFETEERWGSTVVDCIWNESGTSAIVDASVRDARDGSEIDRVELSQAPDHWADDDDPDYDRLQINFRLRSVHRDRVLISWFCNHTTYRVALRWRVAGEARWTYASEFPHSWDSDWVCRGTLDDLQPLTTYEYQLARVDPHEEVRSPEQLQWSATQSITTLGEPVNPTIERNGETVAVSWDRQPDAWAYVVGLRAEGRSWWKRYEPSGEAKETVYFYRVPDGLSLRLELTSPPLDNGEEARPELFDEVITGH